MKIIINFILILSFFISLAVYSVNYSFLDDTAGEYFNDEDWAIFLKTQKQALNQYKDGAEVTWKNPKTGSFGSFVPSNTIRQEGMLCRNLTIVNNANHRTGEATLTFCKVKGEWKGV